MFCTLLQKQWIDWVCFSNESLCLPHIVICHASLGGFGVGWCREGGLLFPLSVKGCKQERCMIRLKFWRTTLFSIWEINQRELGRWRGVEGVSGVGSVRFQVSPVPNERWWGAQLSIWSENGRSIQRSELESIRLQGTYDLVDDCVWGVKGEWLTSLNDWRPKPPSKVGRSAWGSGGERGGCRAVGFGCAESQNLQLHSQLSWISQWIY